MKRVHLVISGDVQGVGYRAWAKSKARGLGLAGFVKNREDGTVEITAEGEEPDLTELVELCRQGPAVSQVSDVNESWGLGTGEFNTFDVVY